MKKTVDPIVTSFSLAENEKKAIAMNIENYLKNHVREGGVAQEQNMAARRDSWIPINMRNVDSTNTAARV